jgi:F-type H+-transporting ATPase subunit a
MSVGLGEELTHAMQVVPVYNFQIPAFDIHLGSLFYHINSFTIQINESAVTMWVISLLIILGAYLITRKYETFPGKIQNIAEIIVETTNSLCKNMIGHHWKAFSAYFGTILLFLGVSNSIGMLGIPGLRPPTKDINLPAALAIMSVVLIIGSQIKYKKFSGMVKSWFEPTPIMFPFKLMEYLIRPLSLCLRLFGNVFGAFIMMELIMIVSHRFLLPTIFSLYFDIFDGLLQAFIFTFLSMLYIGESIEE